MATARSTLVDPTQSGVFHCISRCVRRAFLCGYDHYSGKNFEHRREWIRQRLCQLTEVFAIEVHSYSVMSNHLHVVVRTLPERIQSWSDEEVARRWLRVFSGKRSFSIQSEGTLDELAVQALCRNTERITKLRTRLADLSWFMGALNEPIARRANHEDQCSGRFWEGRFKCQNLDDEGASLACMAYVDLNPLRAGMAATPEQSDFTSIQDRAVAHKARQQLARAPQDPNSEQSALIETAKADACRDHWLAPIGGPPDEHPHREPKSSGKPEHGQPDQAAIMATPPLLTNLTIDQYLELLDWTGRQIRTGKRGHIAPGLRPVLARLELDVDAWVANVEAYGGLFRRIAGKTQRLGELARATGRAWLHGHCGARKLYAKTA